MSVFFDYCDMMYEQAKIECEADIDGDCGSCHGTGSAVDPAHPCSICGGSGLENTRPDMGDTTGPGDNATTLTPDTREMLARVGDRVTAANVAGLPVGTRARWKYPNGELGRVTKRGPDKWRGTHALTDRALADSGSGPPAFIVSVPAPTLATGGRS